MRALGVLVCCVALWLMGVVALLVWPAAAILGAPRARDVLRLVDHLVNVAWFGGDRWASVSAQSWQLDRRWIVRLLDRFEPGHCVQAYSREADVIDFFERRERAP